MSLVCALDFYTHVVDAVRCRGRVVSSSEIRRLIETGNVLRWRAGCWEGSERAFRRRQSGHGIGSATLTVPTLNLGTAAEVIPANGVYITRTRDLETGDRWNSITNVGNSTHSLMVAQSDRRDVPAFFFRRAYAGTNLSRFSAAGAGRAEIRECGRIKTADFQRCGARADVLSAARFINFSTYMFLSPWKIETT